MCFFCKKTDPVSVKTPSTLLMDSRLVSSAERNVLRRLAVDYQTSLKHFAATLRNSSTFRTLAGRGKKKHILSLIFKATPMPLGCGGPGQARGGTENAAAAAQLAGCERCTPHHRRSIKFSSPTVDQRGIHLRSLSQCRALSFRERGFLIPHLRFIPGRGDGLSQSGSNHPECRGQPFPVPPPPNSHSPYSQATLV